MPDDKLVPDGGWSCHANVARSGTANGDRQARLPVPTPAERGLLFRSLSLAAKKFGRSEVPDIFPVMHINPRLFWGWLFFASRLMPGGRLPAQTREKIILRTAWNCRSRYEWGQHVDIALSVGVPDEDIVRVSRGPAAFDDSIERALQAACDEMYVDQRISDTSWTALSGHYNNKMLIEITLLIGHYIMVAGFLNSAGLQLEPSIETRLQAFHARLAPGCNLKAPG